VSQGQSGLGGPRARLAVAFFLYYGAGGALMPVLSGVLKDRGASGTVIGLVMAAFPVGLLVAGPLVSFRADKTGRTRDVMVIAAAIAAVGVVSTTGWSPACPRPRGTTPTAASSPTRTRPPRPTRWTTTATTTACSTAPRTTTATARSTRASPTPTTGTPTTTTSATARRTA